MGQRASKKFLKPIASQLEDGKRSQKIRNSFATGKGLAKKRNSRIEWKHFENCQLKQKIWFLLLWSDLVDDKRLPYYLRGNIYQKGNESQWFDLFCIPRSHRVGETRRDLAS